MLTEFVDNYCERLGPGLWAEPWNLLSNGVFFLSALLVWRQARRLPPQKFRPLALATALLFITGLGSSLFHSFATRWAELADVIPIGAFLLFYLWLFLAVLWGAKRRAVVLGFVAFGIVTGVLALALTDPIFNRSQTYFGTLATLIAMAWFVGKRAPRVALYYWAAAMAFFFALVFRSVDLHVCSHWPIGTHFLWHTLNGVVTYLVLKAAYVWLSEAKIPLKES